MKFMGLVCIILPLVWSKFYRVQSTVKYLKHVNLLGKIGTPGAKNLYLSINGTNIYY